MGIKNRDTKLNFYMTLQAMVKILDLGWEMADPNRREAERGRGAADSTEWWRSVQSEAATAFAGQVQVFSFTL